MKKIISILLALLMVFSVGTAVFAADGADDTPAAVDQQDEGALDVQDEGADSPTTAPEETTTEKTDILEQIKDMPVGEAKALLKIGKVVLKLVKVFVKLGMKFGLIDTDDLVNKVAEAFGLDPETELPPGTADVIVMLM